MKETKKENNSCLKFRISDNIEKASVKKWKTDNVTMSARAPPINNQVFIDFFHGRITLEVNDEGQILYHLEKKRGKNTYEK